MNSTPRLRLTEFSKAPQYTQYNFDDIFVFSSGKNIKKNEASPEYNTPCVRYGELYHMYGEVITNTINCTNLDHSELTFSYGNEILLPSAGEDPLDIGSASALTLKGVAIGRTINVLRPKGNVDYSHAYVSYYINEKLRKKISKLARGASISNVYNSDLKTLKANLPEIFEQQKIAFFLSKVDEKIGLLSEKKDKLTEYKKGVMQQLFNGKWHEQDGQLTFTPPTLRFKADDGSEFPDWEEKNLGDYFNFKKGAPLSKSDLTDTGSNVCIHYGELFTKYREVIRTVFSKTNVTSTKLGFVGDILMPTSDVTPKGLARASCLLVDEVVLSGDLNILRPKTELNSVYFSYKINHFKNEVIRRVSGTTVKHIYAKDIDSIKFKTPVSIQEQTKMANFLLAIDQKIELVNSELNKTKEWKRGLLQQMFV
ncbi:restriction endonuclease subunit S [Aliivibrio sp. SR45-2]|nr:restriction endonuclease subunit S [Aliivibrio sp. SR45-2]